MVGVAVGDKDLVGLAIDHHVGGAVEAFGIVGAAGRTGLAQSHDELAVAGELVDMPASLDIVADPDEIVVIDEYTVPIIAPFVIGTVPTPTLHHLAGLVELDHRRRRHTADHVRRRGRALLAGVERAWALVDPDMVLRVDEDAADGTDDPVARQRLRPGWVDLEFWRLRQGRLQQHGCHEANQSDPASDARHQYLPSASA